MFSHGLILMDTPVLACQQKRTLIIPVGTLAVVNRTYQVRWPIGTYSEGASRESVLSLRPDDNDDNRSFYLFLLKTRFSNHYSNVDSCPVYRINIIFNCNKKNKLGKILNKNTSLLLGHRNRWLQRSKATPQKKRNVLSMIHLMARI